MLEAVTSKRLGVALFGVLAAMFAGCGGEPPQPGDAPAPPAPPAPQTAAAPEASAPQYNVLIVMIDTLRADHLGCHGYARNTSPFIDRLAAQGALFEQAMSPSSFTRESVAALFTGRYPSQNPWGAGWYARPDPEDATLANLFSEAGYATGIFVATPVIAHPDFYAGFDEAASLVEGYGVTNLGPELTARAGAFIEQHAARPWFLYLHYLEPHAPYAPEDRHYLRFADERHPEPLDLYSQVRPHVPELVAEGFGPGEARFEDMILRYDGEIAAVDEAVERLFEHLERLELTDNTIIVITSDHGEEFLDHGFVEHSWYLYQESIHVPLIFWAPGLIAPDRIPGRVSLVDLLPTLNELAGLPPLPAPRGGVSLVAGSEAPHAFAGHGRPVYAELMVPMRTMLRVVLHDDYAYHAAIQWLEPEQAARRAQEQQLLRMAFAHGKKQPPGFWDPPEHEALYNLARDPDEQRNLAGEEPETLARFRDLLEAYRAGCPPQFPDARKNARDAEIAPAHAPGSGVPAAELDEELRANGYAGTAPPGNGVDMELEEQLRGLGYL